MNRDGTPDLGDAIWHLKNDAQYTMGQEGLSTLVWLDGNSTNITNTQINTKLAELETAYTNNAYGRTRANEYKELKEQLDLLYKDMTAGKLDNTGEWHKHIKKVKDDNPKS